MAPPWLQEIIELAVGHSGHSSQNGVCDQILNNETQINSGFQAVGHSGHSGHSEKQSYQHFSFDADEKNHALNQNEEKQAANDALVIPLSVKDEALILAWLEYIGEQDQAQIDEVMARCRQCLDARDYFMGQALKMPKPQPATITCGTCAHFNRVTYHQRLGHCGKGEPEAVAGLWDTDRRYCEQWQQNITR